MKTRATTHPSAMTGRLPAHLLATILLLLVCPPLAAQDITVGLKAYWPMDNAATGGILPDASAGGHNGNMSGNAAISPDGRAGGCLEMAARQDGYVSFPTLTWQPATFSVAFWINPASHAGASSQVASGIGWGGFVFHTAADGSFYIGTDVATRIHSGTWGFPNIPVGQWTHVAFTYASGTARLYLDGRLWDTKPMAAPLAWGGFYIGNPDPQGTLHGRIDEVRIYDRDITSREVELLMAYPHVPVTCTWNGSAGTGWDNAANWTPAAVPTAYDDAVVNACTTCPILSADAVVGTLSVNGGASLGIGPRTLRSRGLLLLLYALVTSNGGTLSGAAEAYITGCTFAGDISLEKTGGGMSTAHNTFTGRLTVTNREGGGILNIGNQGGETFQGEVSMENRGYGITVAYQAPWYAAATLFKEKATFTNATSSAWQMGVGGFGHVTFEKEAVFRNPSNCTLGIWGKVDFLGPVTVENPPPAFSSVYGNSISFMGTRAGVAPVTFHAPVSVANTSNQYAGYSPVDVRFGSAADDSRCVFKPAATLTAGAGGFRRGSLILEACRFESPDIGLSLSSGGTESHSSTLVLGQGTVFAGSLTATAPRLQVGGATFNGEAAFTKTGEGADNWPGGNVFKRKLTITNRASAASPLNMATAADDVVRQ